jgi:hypothetical protein
VSRKDVVKVKKGKLVFTSRGGRPCTFQQTCITLRDRDTGVVEVLVRTHYEFKDNCGHPPRRTRERHVGVGRGEGTLLEFMR